MDKSFHISVVIPAYNAGLFIERAVLSVLAQSRPADEIIVVDDGSRDNTADVVGRFSDKVKLIRQANAGVSAARNAGIHAATGDWIAFLDADDQWLPDYLKTQIELLNRNPHLVWSMANFFTCSCAENRQSPFTAPEKINLFLRGKDTVDDYLTSFQHDIQGHLDTTMIRRDILVSEGVFDESLSVAEDLDLWWRLAYHYPAAGFISEPMAVYNFAASESLTKQTIDVSFYINLIRRHLVLSCQNNRQKDFEPVAEKMLRLWIRGMLFDSRGRDIRRLLNEFPILYPAWYRAWMTLLTVSPGFTTAVCRGISRVVRMFGLRRRVVAPPKIKTNLKSDA
jgi:glycosyltransferase involved in cell wall biosynthesis